MPGQYVLGLDIGGTKCAVVLCAVPKRSESAPLTVLDKLAFPTQTQLGLSHTLEAIYAAMDTVLAHSGITQKQLCAIGISCGGPLDHKTGIIYGPPNLYGWDEVHIVELLEQRYHVRACLQNDANACALAEWRFGAGRGASDLVFLTFGTGMGAGLILNGQLYCGASDMAGEIGHIRMSRYGPAGYGKNGSFEGFCSGGGIAQLGRSMVLEAMQRSQPPAFCPALSDLDALDAKKIAEAAKRGDPLAAEIYRRCGEKLGEGLSILIDLLNPERIILGSIFQRSAELLWPAAENVIRREALSCAASACKILPSQLADRIGDYAAVCVALSQLERIVNHDT